MKTLKCINAKAFNLIELTLTMLLILLLGAKLMLVVGQNTTIINRHYTAWRSEKLLEIEQCNTDKFD